MKITRIKADTHEDWLKLRHQYIGGSDAAAVVGLNPFKSPFALWAEKTDNTEPFEGNLATEVGNYLEEFAAKKFEDLTGKKVQRCNFSLLNDEYPFAIANVDRLILGENAGLEIKTTNEMNMKKFRNGDFPSQYYVQCVHYLAVTGRERWYLAVLIGNRDFKMFTIERDEEEIASLMEAEKAFMKLIKDGTPPPVDGTKATTEAIGQVYPFSTDDDEIELFGLDALMKDRAECMKSIKFLQSRVDEIDNQVKAEMKERSKALVGDWKVSWSSSERKTFDVKAFQKAHPDIDIAGYYKTTNIRTYRVSEIKTGKDEK